MPDDPLAGLTANVIAVDGVNITIDSPSSIGTPWLISDRHGGIGWVEVVRREDSHSVCEPLGDFEAPVRRGYSAVIGEHVWLESPEPEYTPSQGLAPMPFAPHPFGPWTPGGMRIVDNRPYAYRVLAYVGVLGGPGVGRREVKTVWGRWSPHCSVVERKDGHPGSAVLVENEGKISAYPSRAVTEEFQTWPEGTVLISFIAPRRRPVNSAASLLEKSRGQPEPASGALIGFVGELVSSSVFSLPQTSNPLRVGQRVEVWRGRHCLGMAEVQGVADWRARLELVAPKVEGTEVKAGDAVRSRLWHPDRALRVAAHGTFSEPSEIYTKEELKELLEAAGCDYRERVEPGVDLVILGSNLLADEWYRRARNDLRFETMREDDVRAYFLPPE